MNAIFCSKFQYGFIILFICSPLFQAIEPPMPPEVGLPSFNASINMNTMSLMPGVGQNPVEFSQSSMPTPAELAASIIAAAAANAGAATGATHNAIFQQQLHMQPLQHPAATIIGMSPNTSLTILPQQFAASLSSTPNNAALVTSPANVTIRSISSANTSLNHSGLSSSPVPGQLLIPSFYSSKSTTGHISFDSTGRRQTPSLLGLNTVSFNNHHRSGSDSQKSFHKSISSKSSLNSTSKSSFNSSQEKITMKLKKSHFSPNEMVVVGSARDAMEQLDIRYLIIIETKWLLIWHNWCIFF